jgi:hypothetical protein
VINTHTIPTFESVLGYIEFVAVLCGERWEFGIILLVEDTSEKVVLKLHDEVLERI